VSLLLPAVKVISQLTKTNRFDCNIVLQSAGWCKCQRCWRLPPPLPGSPSNNVLPLSQCANSPLGCSASGYEVLLADTLGLLYDCARQDKVDNIRFILDVWSRQRLHLACTNGHAGLVRLLLSRGTTIIASNGSRNPRLNKFKAVEYTLYDKELQRVCEGLDEVKHARNKEANRLSSPWVLHI
jgi:hypothetical protein